MSAGEDFITSAQLKDELNQACSNKSISSDIIKVDENSKEYKRLKPSRQGNKIYYNNKNMTIVVGLDYRIFGKVIIKRLLMHFLIVHIPIAYGDQTYSFLMYCPSVLNNSVST